MQGVPGFSAHSRAGSEVPITHSAARRSRSSGDEGPGQVNEAAACAVRGRLRALRVITYAGVCRPRQSAYLRVEFVSGIRKEFKTHVTAQRIPKILLPCPPPTPRSIVFCLFPRCVWRLNRSPEREWNAYRPSLRAESLDEDDRGPTPRRNPPPTL